MGHETGEGGYVSTQEVIALMLELRKGNVPDLVVFYDGVNDTFSAYQQGVAGIPENEYNRQAEFNQLNWRGGILERSGLYWFAKMSIPYIPFVAQAQQAPKDRPGRINLELANATLDTYVANMQIVNSLAQTYGFHVVFYWQPVISSKKGLSSSEKLEITQYAEAGFYQQIDQTLKQRALSQNHPNFHDLSDAFDDQSETVFIDFSHISEAGNERIADLVVQSLPSISSHAQTRQISSP